MFHVRIRFFHATQIVCFLLPIFLQLLSLPFWKGFWRSFPTSSWWFSTQLFKKILIQIVSFPHVRGVKMSTFFETTSPRNSVPSSAHRTQRRWARCWKTRPRYLRGLWSVWIWKIPAVTSDVPNNYGLKNANFSGMMMVNNPSIRLLQGRWHWVCTHSFPVPVAK